MDVPLPIFYMSSLPYNYYDPNAQPNSLMSGPHSQSSRGSYPGYLPPSAHSLQPSSAHGLQPYPAHGLQPASPHSLQPHPAHGLQPSSPHSLQPHPAHGLQPSSTHSMQPHSAHSLQPSPAYGLQSGPFPLDPPYPPPNPGPSRSGPSHPNYDTGRYYSPRYTTQSSPQNTASLQAVIPRRQDLSPSTSYNLYTTPHVPSLPVHGTSQSGPVSPPPHSPPNPGTLKQNGPLLADPPPPGGKRLHSALLSMMRYTMSQPVHVRISAETWVVGIIVGVVKLAGWVAGSKYRVEFESIDGGRKIGEFGPEDIAPK